MNRAQMLYALKKCINDLKPVKMLHKKNYDLTHNKTSLTKFGITVNTSPSIKIKIIRQFSSVQIERVNTRCTYILTGIVSLIR